MKVNVARCSEHGLHGERTHCFVCGKAAEQVEMVSVAALLADRSVDSALHAFLMSPESSMSEPIRDALKAAVRSAALTGEGGERG